MQTIFNIYTKIACFMKISCYNKFIEKSIQKIASKPTVF